MINFIKVRHRSEDHLEEWNIHNFVELYDTYASFVHPRLAQIDKLHQESLQHRAIKAGLIDKPFDYRPAEYKQYYEVLDDKTSQMKIFDGKTDAEAGFPGLLSIPTNYNPTSYAASIDRWPAYLLSRKLCKEEYEDKNKPLMIQHYGALMELDGVLGGDLKYDRLRDKNTNTKDMLVPMSDDTVPISWEEKVANFQPPTVIEDAKYPANFWTFEYFKTSPFAECLFRMGDDDYGRTLRAKLKVFIQYLETNKDDSPLYLFEDSVRRCEISKKMLTMYKIPEYFQQDLVTDVIPDKHRPPYQWVLMGAKRSGTRMHLDPRCTSAWNLSVRGIKHWVLFRPGVPDNVAKGHVVMTPEEVRTRKVKGNPQTVYYFTKILPRLRRWIQERERKREIRLRLRDIHNEKVEGGGTGEKKKLNMNTRLRSTGGQQIPDGVTQLNFHPCTTATSDFGEDSLYVPEDAENMTVDELEKARDMNKAIHKSNSIKWNELEDGYGFMEFYQFPGEVIYVPSGWYHAVINVTDTIAFTQNFTNRSNFPLVWRYMRQYNKSTTRRWRRQLRSVEPEYAELADILDQHDGYTLSEFRAATKEKFTIKKSSSIDGITDSSDSSSISLSSSSDCAIPWETSDEDAD